MKAFADSCKNMVGWAGGGVVWVGISTVLCRVERGAQHVKINLNSPEIFIVHIMCDIFEILHVSLNKKFPEQGKVWVLWVVNFYKTPGVLSPSNLSSGYLLKQERF